ncbi:MAG TPA: hypothetical protein VFO86_03385, partial [Terriglobia bacterium]|nr:hypothetical protein [Terriglobia bacterium]
MSVPSGSPGPCRFIAWLFSLQNPTISALISRLKRIRPEESVLQDRLIHPQEAVEKKGYKKRYDG